MNSPRGTNRRSENRTPNQFIIRNNAHFSTCVMCRLIHPTRAPLWERKICSAYVRSFFSVMFSAAFPRMRTIFQGVLCTQMFYIIFYVSSPPTLKNTFFIIYKLVPYIDHAKIFLLAFFMYGQKLKPDRKKEFCSGDKKVELQREGNVDTQFSQIPCYVLFIFSRVIEKPRKTAYVWLTS